MRSLARSVPVAIVLLVASMQVVAYDPGAPVLFALEGTFIQETVYTRTMTATPDSIPSDVTLTIHLPVSRIWQYRRTQEISELDHVWSPDPQTTYEEADNLGNIWSTAMWSAASGDVGFTSHVRCREETVFEPTLTWDDDYPVSENSFPEDIRRWLDEDPWGQIQSDAPEIHQLARELSSGAILQIEVAGRILAWVQENVRVAQCDEPVAQVDALWTLQNRMGICGNFANLAVALLRAAGIPAVPVVGLVASSESPDVLHAWIAAYFTDLGWFEFESSSWVPAYGELPVTILTPQHITLSTGEEQGVSSVPFVDDHACSLDVQQKPRELQFVDTEIEPGDAVTWVVTLRSPSYYEIYEWETGYRDLPISLSLDGVPEGWYVGLSAVDLLLRKQDVGAAPSRSLMMTIVPPDDAEAGTQGVISLTARDTGSPGQPVIGVLTAAVSIRAPEVW